MAASFTGAAEISWPRPRGRSGCVITVAISMSGCPRRCMKVGTAKCGVPQKRMRMGLVRRERCEGARGHFVAEILPGWGAAVLRPYAEGSLAHVATTRLVF